MGGIIFILAANPANSESEISGTMTTAMAKYVENTTVGTNANAAWDLVQSMLECCGIAGSRDWKVAGKEIPPSCLVGSSSSKDQGGNSIVFNLCVPFFGLFRSLFLNCFPKSHPGKGVHT